MTSTIAMTVPAQSRFVSTVRVTTASLAAELDFPVDRIEELRVGVNELAACLMEWAQDHGADQIEITYRLGEDQMEVSGLAVGIDEDQSEPDILDDLTKQILSVVTDDFEVAGGSGRILKRRVAA